MTQIEDLVRQALAETPTAPSSTDPLAALDRRVRRARRMIAVGACAVTAAVAAAIVVPLAVLGGDGSPNGLEVARTPTPTSSPAPSTPLQPVEMWWKPGADGLARGMTTGGGSSWLVVERNDGAHALVQFGPTGDKLSETPIATPADFVASGGGDLWVWGGGDGQNPDALLQLVDPADASARPISLTLADSAIFDVAVIGDDAWVTVPDQVLQVRKVNGALTVVSRTDLKGAGQIVATENGHLWVQADQQLVELAPTGGSGPETAATENWSGGLLAASSGDTVWSTDDPQRAVELDPTALGAGSSVALSGKRLMASDRPTALAVDDAGGVYVATVGEEVDYFGPDVAFGPITAHLGAVDVDSLAAAPGGGVVLSTRSGELMHWDPAGDGSR